MARRRRKSVVVRATGWPAVLLLGAIVAALVGVGWRARPTDAAIGEAIRSCVSTNLANARLATLREDGRTVPDAAGGAAWGAELGAVREATISLLAVDRNWLHELIGRGGSRFLVLATIEAPGKPRTQGCFRVQPLGGGAAFALGPYSRWHCYSPL
jgi:hypothetical protein